MEAEVVAPSPSVPVAPPGVPVEGQQAPPAAQRPAGSCCATPAGAMVGWRVPPSAAPAACRASPPLPEVARSGQAAAPPPQAALPGPPSGGGPGPGSAAAPAALAAQGHGCWLRPPPGHPRLPLPRRRPPSRGQGRVGPRATDGLHGKSCDQYRAASLANVPAAKPLFTSSAAKACGAVEPPRG